MKRLGLRSTEWSLAGSFIFILAALIVVAKVKVYRYSETLAEEKLKTSKATFPSSIPVTITGSVFKPGTHQIRPGTPLKKVLSKAKPKKNANLRDLNLEKLIYEPLDLEIEELSEILVHLKLEDGSRINLTVPSSSRICDLQSKIDFPNPTKLKSKKRLKDGEIIDFSKKVAEKRKRSYDR